MEDQKSESICNCCNQEMFLLKNTFPIELSCKHRLCIKCVVELMPREE